jgi:hypothetical protein
MVTPATALADPASDVANELGNFAPHLKPGEPLSKYTVAEPRYAFTKCTAALAAARKSGVKPTQTLIGSFEFHPKATKTADGKYQIKFADAAWICTEYTARFKMEQSAGAIREAVEAAADLKGPPTAETAKGFNPGAGKASSDRGTNCLKAIDKLVKEGIPATTKMKHAKGETTLEDAKKPCQALIEYGTKFEELVAAEYKAKMAERAKKYEAAGIKGAKLALMVEYDNVYWRGRGCEKIDDPTVLAKATVLYQWLENADGTHTIRTYRFAGNAVKGKATDKKYLTEAAAYKGCP